MTFRGWRWLVFKRWSIRWRFYRAKPKYDKNKSSRRIECARGFHIWRLQAWKIKESMSQGAYPLGAYYRACWICVHCGHAEPPRP